MNDLSGTAPHLYRHRHNSLLGQLRRAAICARQVSIAPSVTAEAKVYLVAAEELLELAYAEIYARRVEQDGSVKEMEHFSGSTLNRKRLVAGEEPAILADKYKRYREERR